MTPWVLLVPLVFGTAIAVAKSSKPKGEDGKGVEPKGDDHPPIEPNFNGISSVRQAAIMVDAPKPWQDFFVLVAQGESGGNHDVGLGIQTDAPPWSTMNSSKKEAKAALKAYDRNKDEYVGCWPRASYGFGSGGWFGILPANGLIAFKKDDALRCLHPWTVFDPKISMIMAAWMARRLTGWPNWNGTVLSLRVGWGSPESMGSSKVLDAKRDKFAEDCMLVGMDPSFLDEKLPNWKPAPATTLFESLGGDKGWLPE